MKRVYADVSAFNAPLNAPTLQLTGLGALARRYEDVALFHAPYQNGWFQDNTLYGLGQVVPPMPCLRPPCPCPPGTVAVPGGCQKPASAAVVATPEGPLPPRPEKTIWQQVQDAPSWMKVGGVVALAGVAWIAFTAHRRG